MPYSFKSDVISKLPANYTFVDMFSINGSETNITVKINGITTNLIMPKVDIGKWFINPVVLTVDRYTTYDQLYNRVSELFGLGLIKGIDYFNQELVGVPEHALTVSLPILENSHGYFGSINCLVLDSKKTFNTDLQVRNVKEFNQAFVMMQLRMKTFLSSNIFRIRTPTFQGYRLTIEFVNLLVKDFDEMFGQGYKEMYRDEFLYGTVTKVFNDGLTDICVLTSMSGESFFIRFGELYGNLPDVTDPPEIGGGGGEGGGPDIDIEL